jgi:hypothetical protein
MLDPGRQHLFCWIGFNWLRQLGFVITARRWVFILDLAVSADQAAERPLGCGAAMLSYAPLALALRKGGLLDAGKRTVLL